MCFLGTVAGGGSGSESEALLCCLTPQFIMSGRAGSVPPSKPFPEEAGAGNTRGQPWLLGPPVNTEAAASPAGRGTVTHHCFEPGFMEERPFWSGMKRTRGCAHIYVGLSHQGQEGAGSVHPATHSLCGHRREGLGPVRPLGHSLTAFPRAPPICFFVLSPLPCFLFSW